MKKGDREISFSYELSIEKVIAEYDVYGIPNIY